MNCQIQKFEKKLTIYSLALSPDTSSDEDQAIKNQPNTALLSLILTFGTFLLAYALKGFRNSQFLGRSVSLSIKFSGLV